MARSQPPVGLRHADVGGELGRGRRADPSLEMAVQVDEHGQSSSRTAVSSAASMLSIQPALSASLTPE